MDCNVYEFLKKLLDPEIYGMNVGAEVRDEARMLLGMGKAETLKDTNESNDPQ